MALSDSLTLKNTSRHQNRYPKCFSSKVMGIDLFLHNGSQCHVFMYVSFKPLKMFVGLLKCTDPSYFGDNLSSKN